MKIDSEQAMLNLGKEFAKSLPTSKSSQATVIELIGDVGTGKTTFVRGLASSLGVTEPVTSPSFTISKSYALPGGKTLVHYDFYRLPDPGLMADDLAESISNPNNLVIVEWANSVSNLLPKDRIAIKIQYDDAGNRICSSNSLKSI